MKRLPLLPTLLVAAAVAAMIGLGVWQLQRREEKAAMIAHYAAAARLPEMAFPAVPGDLDAILFRQARAFCLEVTGWRVVGGGAGGYRHLAECRTGAEGPGLLVDMGVSADPRARPAWRGGAVSGTIAGAPDPRTLARRLSGGSAPLAPMLVATTPAPGLQVSAPPSPATMPNNHLFYAIQWFFFAGAAAVIYALALRRRRRDG